MLGEAGDRHRRRQAVQPGGGLGLGGAGGDERRAQGTRYGDVAGSGASAGSMPSISEAGVMPAIVLGPMDRP